MRALLAIPVLLIGLLALTAGAGAAIVPPGNSAATQYSESVPGAGGEETRPPGASTGTGGQSGSSQTGSGATAIPAGTASELRKLGPDGAAALRMAETTAPKHDGKHGNGGKGAEGEDLVPSRGSEAAAPAAGGSSGVGEVLGGVAGTSSGGLNFLPPLIIALVLVCAGTYGLRRRRGAEPDTGSSLR